MSFKVRHVHADGSRCYEIKPPNAPFTCCPSPLTDPRLININGKECGVARWSYTGKWHIYNLETGKKIDELTTAGYELLIKPLRYENIHLVPHCMYEAPAALGQT